MFTKALQERVAARPAPPLFTHYDGRAGTRIELSAVTFANWVDKTALLIDDLGGEPGSSVRLDVARTHPGHWVCAVWVAAAWQRACSVALEGPADLVVTGPDGVAAGAPTVVCSLHPWGLALPQVPDGCVDYAEALAQPDIHAVEPAELDAVAFLPDVTHADVAAVPGSAGRSLFVAPPPGWATIAATLVAPVLGGGSTVVVTRADAALVERVASSERVTARPRIRP